MLSLILAIISSAGVSLVMRLSVDHVKNNISMLSSCYVCCTALAVFYTMPGKALNTEGIGTATILGIAAGVLLLIGFVFLQYNVRSSGVVLSAIFSKLGILVPTGISILFFHERPSMLQGFGFLLSVIAIILINYDKDSDSKGFGAGLLLLLLANGLADAMAKIYDELGTPDLSDYYLCLSFFVALILSILLAVSKKQKLSRPDVLYGLLLGIPNYYSIRFLVRALTEVPAVITYPTYSVATIVIISFAGVLFFKERLSSRQITAIVIILAALIMLNI